MAGLSAKRSLAGTKLEQGPKRQDLDKMQTILGNPGSVRSESSIEKPETEKAK